MKYSRINVEIFAVIALAIILWMVWQLFRARKFNHFKGVINRELKPMVIAQIKDNMIEYRSDIFPNCAAHEQATIYYWCQYPSRILQAAIVWQLIDKDWLRKTGNIRNYQHLFFIEKDKLADIAKTKDLEEKKEQ